MAAHRAGKTLPAVAVAGTLAVGVQGHASPGSALTGSALTGSALSRPVAHAVIHSFLDARSQDGASLDAAVQPTLLPSVARSAGVVHPAHTASVKRHAETGRTYTVRPGDTLSGIAFRYYGRALAWKWLYQVNRTQIKNPNLIFPGQVLWVPRHLPASFRRSGAGTVTSQPEKTQRTSPKASDEASVSSPPRTTTSLSGTLGCGGLEELWVDSGGAPSEEVTAASIAMAESSGQQFATSTIGARGYWQIAPVHGALSTYDAEGNARAAVIISDDGANWSPWVTFVDGAYLGQC